MEVKDVLVGQDSVLVETSDGSQRFDRVDEEKVKADPQDVPSEIVTALRERGLKVTDFPITVKHYVHDEATPHERQELADQLGMSEDSDVVRAVANVGYEIELTVRVEDEETAVLTHVDGHELVNSKEVY